MLCIVHVHHPIYKLSRLQYTSTDIKYRDNHGRRDPCLWGPNRPDKHTSWYYYHIHAQLHKPGSLKAQTTRKTAATAQNPTSPQTPLCEIQIGMLPANVCIAYRSHITNSK